MTWVRKGSRVIFLRCCYEAIFILLRLIDLFHRSQRTMIEITEPEPWTQTDTSAPSDRKRRFIILFLITDFRARIRGFFIPSYVLHMPLKREFPKIQIKYCPNRAVLL